MSNSTAESLFDLKKRAATLDADRVQVVTDDTDLRGPFDFWLAIALSMVLWGGVVSAVYFVLRVTTAFLSV